MWLWSFSLSKTTFALPAAAPSPLLSQQVFKQPWVLEIETFLHAEIIYLPETTSQSEDSPSVQWKRTPRLQTTKGFIIREAISVSLFSTQITVWRRTTASLELWAFAILWPLHRALEKTLAFSETDDKYTQKKSFSSDAATKNPPEHQTAFSDMLKLFPLNGSRVRCQNIFECSSNRRLRRTKPSNPQQTSVPAGKLLSVKCCDAQLSCGGSCRGTLWFTAWLADELERQAVTGLRAWERLQPLAESSHFTSEIFGKRENGRKFCQSCKLTERYSVWRCQRGRTGFGGTRFVSEYWTNQEKANFTTADH